MQSRAPQKKVQTSLFFFFQEEKKKIKIIQFAETIRVEITALVYVVIEGCDDGVLTGGRGNVVLIWGHDHGFLEVMAEVSAVQW